MIPAVPGMVSRTIAAIVLRALEARSTCSRCASARSHSSSSVVEWNAER